MKKELTKKDYEAILDYYNLNDDKKMSLEEMKQSGEKILATKLCRCIKKVTKQNPELKEQNALAICREALFNKRNLDFYNFKCKQKYSFLPRKKSKQNKKLLYKTKKNITMKYKLDNKKQKSKQQSKKSKQQSKQKSKQQSKQQSTSKQKKTMKKKTMKKK